MTPRRGAAALLLLCSLAAAAAAADGALNPYYLPGGFETVYPNAPLPGDKVTFRLLVQNVSPNTTPKARIAAWANATGPIPCGSKGDASGSVPALKPLQSAWVQVKVKMPETPGPANVLIFIDSDCTAFNKSDLENQYRKPLAVTNTPAEYPRLAFSETLVNWKTATLYRWAEVTPALPVSGSTFSVKLSVRNLGSAPSTEGLRVAVMAVNNLGPVDCGSKLDGSYTLPSLKPGQTHDFEISGLPAPGEPALDPWRMRVVVDPDCKILGTNTFDERYLTYQTSAAPSYYIGGTQTKKQFTYSVKTAPASPKAGGTMKVKVSVFNAGDLEGPVGKVALWTTPFNSDSIYGFYSGPLCNYTNVAALQAFDDVIVKPGKSKKVTLTEVPVPAAPGTYQASAIPDAACASPAAKGLVVAMPAFASFVVKA